MPSRRLCVHVARGLWDGEAIAVVAASDNVTGPSASELAAQAVRTIGARSVITIVCSK